MVASSLAETITLNTGWNATRVTGPRWPVRLYFSGGRGIQSDGFRRSLGWPPPVWISFSVSDNRASRSITYHQWGLQWIFTKYRDILLIRGVFKSFEPNLFKRKVDRGVHLYFLIVNSFARPRQPDAWPQNMMVHHHHIQTSCIYGWMSSIDKHSITIWLQILLKSDIPCYALNSINCIS